jgi:hypothetical protein
MIHLLPTRHSGPSLVFMPAYQFTTVSSDGTRDELLGAIELTNDDEAASFGRRIIQDMIDGETGPFADWTMSVTQEGRVVHSIPFADS